MRCTALRDNDGKDKHARSVQKMVEECDKLSGLPKLNAVLKRQKRAPLKVP